MQKSAEQLRVTAQLIDAQSGNHVWAEKFDRPFKDIFAVQDEITATTLANILAFINRNGEALPLIQKASALDPLYDPALDTYLGRAYTLIGKFDLGVSPLRDCVSRAPDFWPCHAWLAVAYARSGKLDLARQELAETRRFYPLKSVKQCRDQGDLQPGPETDRVYKNLILAGLRAE